MMSECRDTKKLKNPQIARIVADSRPTAETDTRRYQTQHRPLSLSLAFSRNICANLRNLRFLWIRLRPAAAPGSQWSDCLCSRKAWRISATRASRRSRFLPRLRPGRAGVCGYSKLQGTGIVGLHRVFVRNFYHTFGHLLVAAEGRAGGMAENWSNEVGGGERHPLSPAFQYPNIPSFRPSSPRFGPVNRLRRTSQGHATRLDAGGTGGTCVACPPLNRPVSRLRDGILKCEGTIALGEAGERK